MSLTMYRAAAPALTHFLGSLSAILDKAIAHCEARKIDPAVLANYRLAPDMFALTRQVQIATDQAKGCIARLAGVDVPVFEDTEASLEDLKARIAKTVAFISGIGEAQLDGAEDRTITLKIAGNELTFPADKYVFQWVLPNFYFHVTTTYDILRHAGVELGKRDFLGGF